MGLYFKILDSTDPLALGKTIELKPGLIIGRTKGNLIIEDDRISTVHAEVQVNNQGEFFLVDKESRNGIKVQGKRIIKLLLSPGLIFQIGDTLIETSYIQSRNVKTESSESSSVVEAIEILKNLEIHEFNAKKPVFFEKPIKLNVIQGVQLNQTWLIEYGPFKFGSGCVGGLLVGDNMPLEVFEIYETNSSKVIRTLCDSGITKINSIPLKNESIIDKGDILSIHLSEKDITRIKFEF